MTTQTIGIQPSNTSAIVTTVGFVPCEGPKTLPVLINFALGSTYNLDLSQIIQTGFVSCIQCLYIDNSQNGASISVSCNQSNQNVSIPAYCQGYIPLLAPVPTLLTVTSTLTATVMLQLLNFYQPPAVWNTRTFAPTFTVSGSLQVSDPILDACIAANEVAVAINPYGVTDVDHSTTITTGGTAQVAIAANSSRKRFIISNPDTATETLYMYYASGSNGPIALTPAMTWDENGTSVDKQAIYVKAATTGHAFTAYEGT